jgi:hypothetical protein
MSSEVNGLRCDDGSVSPRTVEDVLRVEPCLILQVHPVLWHKAGAVRYIWLSLRSQRVIQVGKLIEIILTIVGLFLSFLRGLLSSPYV